MRSADSDPRTDPELVQAANAGDLSAFEALYYRHRDWVIALACRFNASHADSLDVLQDTFAYLLKKLPRLRLTARMTTFLYPVVKNLSIRARRKRQRYVSDDELLRDLPAEDARTTSRAELAEVLAGVSEKQREVLLMRFVDGMTLREIAGALKRPLGTVKSRLYNALRTLRADERTRRHFLK